MAVGTDVQRPQSLFNDTRSIGIATAKVSDITDFGKCSEACSYSQNNQKGTSNVAIQAAIGNKTMNSTATSPMMTSPRTTYIPAMTPEKISPKAHNAVVEEMRKQLAHVRSLAESMDSVVNIDDIDAEMRKRGKGIVDAECKRTKENKAQHRNQISKLAKSLQKYIKDVELSVSDVSDRECIAECHSTDIVDWNLHGNADILQGADATLENGSSTLSERSSRDDAQHFSRNSTRSLPAILRRRENDHIGLKVRT